MIEAIDSVMGHVFVVDEELIKDDKPSIKMLSLKLVKNMSNRSGGRERAKSFYEAGLTRKNSLLTGNNNKQQKFNVPKITFYPKEINIEENEDSKRKLIASDEADDMSIHLDPVLMFDKLEGFDNSNVKKSVTKVTKITSNSRPPLQSPRSVIINDLEDRKFAESFSHHEDSKNKESNGVSGLSEFNSNNDERPGQPEMREISKVSAVVEHKEKVESRIM